MDEFANIKLGSKYSFETFTFFKDLNAKIAIGSSVQPSIIFLHFCFTSHLLNSTSPSGRCDSEQQEIEMW